MSEEPRSEWLPPKAPGAQTPREWHSVPEPEADRRTEGAAPGAPELASDRRTEPAPPGAPPSPFAASAHPPSSARDARDWWHADRAAESAASPVPMRVPVARPAGNGQALASLLLGIAGLVLFFAAGFGLVFVLNLPCSILAWVFGVQGRRKVDRGETAERRGMAQAGMVLGIVGTVIGGLAIVAWALGFLLSDELRDQFQREWERRQNA